MQLLLPTDISDLFADFKLLTWVISSDGFDLTVDFIGVAFFKSNIKIFTLWGDCEHTVDG